MKFEFYREVLPAGKQTLPGGVATTLTKLGDWRWRLIASNGNNNANGGEGYRNFRDMLKSLRSIYGDSLKRTRELKSCLVGWERVNGKLAKPFEFYTG